jgi:hypothetical protein
MARWQFWKSATRRHHLRPRPRTQLVLETLEDRNLLSVPPGLTVAPGFNVTVFATSPTGASQPDSITVDGQFIFVGYGNGVAADGSDGGSSTIVEYNRAGQILQEFSVLGHNDGMKVDPYTHMVWALQNEDGNPNLVVINPTSRTEKIFSFGPVADGGGYDDIAFVGGNAYLTESNPQSNPNTAPAVVQARLVGTHVEVRPVLFGDATATNLVTGAQVTLNLQDPDSMTVNPNGSLVFTSQADDELLIIRNPGSPAQTASVIPLTDATGTPVSIDDTLFPPDRPGAVLVTDLSTGTIYRISGPGLGSIESLSAARDIGEVGTLNPRTGVFTPVVSGLGSPRGLAFLPLGPADHGR